jgi:hypothetical protein
MSEEDSKGIVHEIDSKTLTNDDIKVINKDELAKESSRKPRAKPKLSSQELADKISKIDNDIAALKGNNVAEHTRIANENFMSSLQVALRDMREYGKGSASKFFRDKVDTYKKFGISKLENKKADLLRTNDFNELFPDKSYLEDSEKGTFMDAVDKGVIQIACGR